MKLLLLTAIIAAVAASPVIEGPTWPWQVGKVYRYVANSNTLVNFEESQQNGNSIKAQLVVSVKAAGHLQAKLEDAQYAAVTINSDKPIEYKPILNIDQTFDIFVDGGRVVSINFPKSLSVANENLIKSFISALQADLSTYGHVEDYPNTFDHESFQGLFKKMEVDLAGECDTLYSISPLSAKWRLDVPEFSSEEDPIEIVKTKNYGSCKKLLGYNFGVPEGALFKGIAQSNDEKQLIKHTSHTHMVVGKQGPIYKSEVLNAVFASPVMYGKQKAEVESVVRVTLTSVEDDNTTEWQKLKEFRSVDSLLFTVDHSWSLFTYDGEHTVAKAQQLLQQISPLLQNPNRLEKEDFLIKFNVLVYMLLSMNSEQLTQMTNSIEISKTSMYEEKNVTWIVYRDAVAQCGTSRALNEIKSWILTKKIEGSEAADVVTGIASTLTQPSQAVLTDFFNFAMCPEVLEQKYLNNSALLAVSRLLRSSKNDDFIVNTVISRFSKELKQAIDNGDSTRAQVYVIVLGNLAHPSILKVFAPYLEGQVTVTKYLRTQMVTSLKTLANLKCKYVRSLLFSILRNTAEPYEVRVAAALNIFLAFPSAEMMEAMAQMTKYDPSTQVRAVLTNSITLAAGLKEPRFSELAKTAKSVLNLIPNERYGYSYSTDSLVDGYTGDEDFSFFRELSYIGSTNTLLPKYHRSALRFKGTGLEDERELFFSISDMMYITNDRMSRVGHYMPFPADATFKYAAKQISDLFDIKRPAEEPLEGAIFYKYKSQQKLFTFDKKELQSIIQSIYAHMILRPKSDGYHYTKIFRENLVYVEFPLASGMSFTYQYSEPTIVKAEAKFEYTLDEAEKVGSLESKINITYARNIIGTVGFMDYIGEVLVGAGVINKLQVHLPAKIKPSYKQGEEFSITIEPVHTDDDINLVHMSVLPYTGTQKKDSITYDLNVIKRSPEHLISTDVTFGHWAEMYFNLNGQSYSSDYKNLKKSFNADLLTDVGNLLYQKDIAFTSYDFKYLYKEASAKSVKFTVFFDKLYNQKNSGEMQGTATDTEHVEPNSAKRRKEMAKTVSTGIEAAEVTLADISAVFDGPRKEEFVFTAAYANSFVDPKTQIALFARNHDQYNAVIRLNKEGAKIVPLNFEEALKNKIKITYDADIKFGNFEDIKIQGFGERTDQYTEMLRNSGYFCLFDVSNGNLYQKDCHEMIIKAHAPDYFKSTVTYSGREMIFLRLVNIAYNYLKDEYSMEGEIDPFMRINENNLEIEAQAFYLDNYYNYNLTSKIGFLSLSNVEGSWHDPYIMAVYGPINTWERARNCYTGYQYMPYCAVDDNEIRTFSGRSYEYKLTSSWHVVMVDAGKFDNLVILARRPSDKGEEVYVSYRSEHGKSVELEIKPNHLEVKSNGNKTCEGAYTMYWDYNDVYESPLLEYYTLAEGVQVFNILDRHLRLMYDQQRLVIFTDEHRSTTKGICGQSTGQISDDYMTPWGRVDLPELYGASFSLEGEFSDPKTVELKEEAKKKAYHPVTKYTKVLSSDAEWSKLMNKTVKCALHQHIVHN